MIKLIITRDSDQRILRRILPQLGQRGAPVVVNR